MIKTLDDQKTIERLAIIATKKAGPEDNIAEVTKLVIANYVKALDIIQQHNDRLISEKNAFKLLQRKKQNKDLEKQKEKLKVKKQTVNE